MKNYSITYICFVALTISNFITAGTYKIAFGSCLDQDYPQPIWQSIKNENIKYAVFGPAKPTINITIADI